MIVGMGIDLVAVPELATQLADGASVFAAKTFTSAELLYAEKNPSHDPVRHLAARYAAKEATLKALDSAAGAAGVTTGPVPLSDIEVESDDAHRPGLALHGEADGLARRLHIDRALVSLTHDGAYAMAVVVLERIA
jgi:holo-[acyl-carrier protein] synthase